MCAFLTIVFHLRQKRIMDVSHEKKPLVSCGRTSKSHKDLFK